MLKVKPDLKKVVLGRIEARSSNPNPAPGGGNWVEARVLENMQCEAKAGNFIIRGDEPVEGGGDGTAALPTQNFMAGAAFCALVWTVKSAALLDAKLDDVRANAQITNDGAAMYAREDREAVTLKFALKLMIQSHESDDTVRKVAKKALLRCPVWNTLRRAAPTEITLFHNGTELKM